MTRNTDRYNIKPVLFNIVFMVMVFLRLFATRTLQSIRMNQFANFNSIINSTSSVNFWFVFFVIALVGLSLTYFTGFTLQIPVFICFVFFGFSIFVHIFTHILFSFFGLAIFFIPFTSASFTDKLAAFFSRVVFMKFSERFRLFAFRTLRSYDSFSHFRFLSKRSWLEPLQTQYLCGSSYYSNNMGDVK